MSSELKAETLPVQDAPLPPKLRRAVMSDASASHLLKMSRADSCEISMYHQIAAFGGEGKAKSIARLLGWKVSGCD